ncbi:MAG: dihydrolipoyl dehydrogenase [Spirochaetaceae bacterium]|nr:MAG: dihydrolipoyl dehydrogenase [Spirochaetaceae bacterium]
MAHDTYDVIVIGAGPGGYVAAIRAAQLGLSAALVEKRETLGGTCLNIGCIPSKALLDSSELYAKTKELALHGIDTGAVKLDLDRMHARKQQVVDKLTGGVAALVKGRKIALYTGAARVSADRSVVIATDAGEKSISASHVVLATGSVPIELPFMPFDGETVVSSTEALAFGEVPKRLVVVGAGAIGLELGSVWARLGSDVTVVEIMDEILPGWDAQVAKTLRRELGKQGIEFKLGHKVTGVSGKKGKRSVTVETPDGSTGELPADRILVAVGRRPFYDGLGIDSAGVAVDERSKRITVNERFETSVPGVYAIGDLIHGPMLAHKAEEEGVAVAEVIAGKPGHVNYDTIPGVVYTWPEAACVGRSEEELGKEGVPFRKGVFSFGANGRALAMDAPAGFVKILAHEQTDAVLGAQIVGPWASDLIGEIVTIMEFGGSAEDIARTTHAHPTLAEVVKEAAMAVDGRSIHSR